MTDEKKVRSVDDIAREIEDIAFNGEGTDKLRALKMLREDRGGSAITLPEPLNREERIHRLTRIMKAYGTEMCRTAFALGFPRTADELGDVAPIITPDDLTEDEERRCLRIKTLKKFYKEFPKLKKPGVPSGFPSGRGAELQAEWCQNAARKIIRDQKQAQADEATYLQSLKSDAPQA